MAELKRINNPLTLIGLFAGTSEIAGTAVLPFAAAEHQVYLIAYVTLFPVLLVFLFFFTLWLNPRVLYGPSDYQNEDNFVRSMGGIVVEPDPAQPEDQESQAKLLAYIGANEQNKGYLRAWMNMNGLEQVSSTFFVWNKEYAGKRVKAASDLKIE